MPNLVISMEINQDVPATKTLGMAEIVLGSPAVRSVLKMPVGIANYIPIRPRVMLPAVVNGNQDIVRKKDVGLLMEQTKLPARQIHSIKVVFGKLTLEEVDVRKKIAGHRRLKLPVKQRTNVLGSLGSLLVGVKK